MANEMIHALEWESGINPAGLKLSEVESEVEKILSEGLANADQLISLCDSLDAMNKASARLYSSMENLLPRSTYNTQHNDTLSSWRGGIGSAVSQLLQTHWEFSQALQVTSNRIRATLKRIEKTQNNSADESQQQLGMNYG